MTIPAVNRRATYEDLCRVPDHLIAEILDGELFTTPRPAVPHAHAASVLGGEIMGPFHRGRGGPGGWWILFEPELHLRNDVIVPDFAGWTRARMPVLPATPALELAPDWVCEILSPSTEAIDRVRTLSIYARESVPHGWLLNPTSRTLEVLRRDAGRWVVVMTAAGDDVVRAEPFDAIELELSALWLASPVDTSTSPT
jgi:Uma2 family endonuclease